MLNKPKACIVDLDGTLCNIEHRRKYLNENPKNWVAFSRPENIAKDTPNQWCVDLIKGLQRQEYCIIFVSGRAEDPGVREVTIEWLRKYLDLPPIALTESSNWAHLYMRKAQDYRKDNVIKEEIYNNHIKERYEVMICVDDRSQVVDFWRSIGLVCLQCDKGDF